ncbi:hypothetical protein N7491_008368 [Penicillium cf. griseofulvum]|nr:hypothetical protein N7491_008368 [Penicillium cf. griseofulvum]
MSVAAPKIKLYTNHNCPWAHRAHIALTELNLPYDEEIIDLYQPRTPEFLKINPRGLVPTMEFDGEIITESAILTPSRQSFGLRRQVPRAPLVRARINFFVDAYFSKAQSNWATLLIAKTDEKEKAAVAAYLDTVTKHVDPLLVDAAPFFGGSTTITLAEVLAGSWLLRVYSLPRYGIVPSSLLDDLATKAPNFDRWAKEVVKHPSVRCIWDEEKIVEGTKGWIAKQKASI